MKKITILLLSVLMMFCIAGCSGTTEEQPEEQVDYEIALVTDSGLIMDGGYSEVAWEAITEFGTENGVSHKYYKAAEATDNAYAAVIADAVEKGAKVVVADGYSFEKVVYDAQKEYEDVKFILLDAEPADEKTHKVNIANNTTAVLFASEQAGYLAGYAAVLEGYTELGFMGADNKPVISDYGIGFVQGADSAAQDIGVGVNIKYHYADDDEDKDAVIKQASEWYEEGTQVIFACGTTVEQPVVEAAEMHDQKVICYETDKSQMSDTVLTSAVKDIFGALETVLGQYIDDEFPGGDVVKYDASNDGIGIEIENGRFENMSEGSYKTELQAIKEGNITVDNSTKNDLDSLELMYVNIQK